MFEKLITDALAAKGWASVKLTAELHERGVEVTTRTVENWLSGRNTPRLECAGAICDALDIPAESLIAACSPASKAERAAV